MLKLGDRVRIRDAHLDAIVIYWYISSLNSLFDVVIDSEIDNIVVTRLETELEFIEETSIEFLVTHSFQKVRKIGQQRMELETHARTRG